MKILKKVFLMILVFIVGFSTVMMKPKECSAAENKYDYDVCCDQQFYVTISSRKDKNYIFSCEDSIGLNYCFKSGSISSISVGDFKIMSCKKTYAVSITKPGTWKIAITDTNGIMVHVKEHQYDDGCITTYPTCISEGIKTYTCKLCGQKKTERIPKVPAKMVDVNYSTHVQDYGWQGSVSNGDKSGTTGQSKRLEAIKISLGNTPYKGGIDYSTHVQDYGWQKQVSNGQLAGTVGKAKRLEAIKINLTGELAKYYDIYYRVHAQNFGWMGWAKNGEAAGTAGYSYRLEAIEIKVVQKGQTVPSNAGCNYTKPFSQK